MGSERPSLPREQIAEFCQRHHIRKRALFGSVLRNDFSSVSDVDMLEIEIAVTQLTPKDLARLIKWLDDYRAQMWDKQIEEDVEGGRLNAVLAEVDAEYAAGSSQPL